MFQSDSFKISRLQSENSRFQLVLLLLWCLELEFRLGGGDAADEQDDPGLAVSD